MPIVTSAETNEIIGERKSTLETPVVVADLDVMDRNIREFVEFAERQDVSLRSHVKTHKIPGIAHMQNKMSDGGGIVCQTLSEAEVMVQNGLRDIYLSYMVVDDKKLDRLITLSKRADEFVTTVDCPGNVHPLQSAAKRHSTTIDVVLELEVGLERVGADLGQDAVEMAGLIDSMSNLNLVGVMAFEGHLKRSASSKQNYMELATKTMDRIEHTVDAIESEGISIEEVKVGSTATSKFSGTHDVVTEINPGMYLFNDVGELRARSFEVGKNDCAVTVITEVISKPTDDRVIVDAGSKTISFDLDFMPVPKNRNDIRYVRKSEEHGYIDTSDCDDSVIVGDRLEFIIPHVCTTINLHDRLIGLRDDRIELIWDIAARGKVR